MRGRVYLALVLALAALTVVAPAAAQLGTGDEGARCDSNADCAVGVCDERCRALSTPANHFAITNLCSYAECVDACRDLEGGYEVASIASAAQNYDAVKTLRDVSAPVAYLGLVKSNSGEWQFEDGTNNRFTAWDVKTEQPDNWGEQDETHAVFMASGLWADWGTGAQKMAALCKSTSGLAVGTECGNHAVCKDGWCKFVDGAPVCAAFVADGESCESAVACRSGRCADGVCAPICAEGWAYACGACYGLSDNHKHLSSHFESIHTLEVEGAELASVHCDEVSASLVTFEDVYIGAYQPQESDTDWHNVDCTAWDYENWKSGEPNDWGAGEDAIVISASLEDSTDDWQDRSATSLFRMFFRAPPGPGDLAVDNDCPAECQPEPEDGCTRKLTVSEDGGPAGGLVAAIVIVPLFICCIAIFLCWWGCRPKKVNQAQIVQPGVQLGRLPPGAVVQQVGAHPQQSAGQYPQQPAAHPQQAVGAAPAGYPPAGAVGAVYAPAVATGVPVAAGYPSGYPSAYPSAAPPAISKMPGAYTQQPVASAPPEYPPAL